MNIEDPRTQFMNLSNFVRMNGDEPNASRSFELNRSSAPAIRASRVSVCSMPVYRPLTNGFCSLLMHLASLSYDDWPAGF